MGASAGWAVILAAGLIVLATAAVFSNSFAGSFVFDDNLAIVDNPTIHHLWPIWQPLCPPRQGETVTARPLLNLSLAINYAISGYGVWSYHTANLAIHILGALLLFGILRRTLLLPRMRDRWSAAALPLAFVVALLWAIHPLQTESVTYIVQRAESLVGLFYLLTLYCFIRGAEGNSPIFADAKIGTVPTIRGASVEGAGVRGQGAGWYVGSVIACLLGMASKEVMISAPLVVLLYDRTFCAGSFREAWRRRYGFYLALAGTWLLLAGLVLSMSTLGTAIGPGSQQFTWWSYLLTQPGVIVHYLRLAVWPSELCLDYDWPPASTVAEVLLPATVVAGLIAATVWALLKRSAWGFLGAWFFAILAPTSSVVPIGQAAFEHRMYLPLAAVVTGAAFGRISRRAGNRRTMERSAARVAGRGRRFGDVGSRGHGDSHLLSQRRLPEPALHLGRHGGQSRQQRAAHNGLALALAEQGQFSEAIAHYRKALEIKPRDAEFYTNLGVTLAELGRLDEAITQYQKALEIRPDFSGALNDLGLALSEQGHLADAMAQFERSLEIDPNGAKAHSNLGAVLAKQGRRGEAVAHLQKAREIMPDDAEVLNNLGVMLVNLGQFDEAIVQYRKALEIKPEYAKAHNNLGVALLQTGRSDEAIAHCRKAVELRPSEADYHYNLANALDDKGQYDEAIAHYETALKIKPDYAQAHNNFGTLLARRGELDQAIAHYQKAVELEPDYMDACFNLGLTLAKCGRFDEAIAHYRQALKVKPDCAAVYDSLGTVLAECGRVDEAITEYRRALELTAAGGADSVTTHYNLAVALVRKGLFGEGISHYQKVLEINPGHVETLNNIGLALAQCGRFDEAVAHFQKALEIKPGDTDARRNLGVAESQREGLRRILVEKRESLRLHPDDLALLNGIAYMLATNPNASIRNGAEAVELRDGPLNFPGARIRPFSTRWPPPAPRRAGSPRPCKRRARPWNWPRNKTTRP